MRINRALARVGVCSRREADVLIEQGRVLVNGMPAVKGAIVDTTAMVQMLRGGTSTRVSLAPITHKPRLWMHNKQKGVLVSRSDPEGRVCLMPELCRHLNVQHLIPIGRLDYTSEGLILLTDDGVLAQRVMRSSIPRNYTLRVRGDVDEEKLKRLQQGITVRGVTYKPLYATLGGPQTGSNAWINVTMREGKNRELRNIMEFGLRYTVARLLRIGFGPYRLPRALPAGETMEVENLFRD
jgi:23S rRNA pseudouridine2605 synthase